MIYMFTIIGISFSLAVVICAIPLIGGCFIKLLSSIRHKYKIKHRFDKPPTARCYCRDCCNYKNDQEYCDTFGWFTSDHDFCSFADPK